MPPPRNVCHDFPCRSRFRSPRHVLRYGPRQGASLLAIGGGAAIASKPSPSCIPAQAGIVRSDPCLVVGDVTSTMASLLSLAKRLWPRKFLRWALPGHGLPAFLHANNCSLVLLWPPLVLLADFRASAHRQDGPDPGGTAGSGYRPNAYVQIPDSDPAGVVAACNGYLKTFGIF